MENTSTALIIAGGVLIGVLVLSIAIVLYTNFRESATITENRIEKERIKQFNSQFLIYSRKEDLNIYDVINIASIAEASNYKYGANEIETENNEASLYVHVNAASALSDIPDSKASALEYYITKESIKGDLINNFGGIGADGKYIHKYRCEVEYSSITNRIYKIMIYKKT